MDILAKIRAAGVVGAGGAGFPTHVKLDCRVSCVIANGAECEPLLQVDRQLMQRFAADIIAGLSVAMEQVGACEGVVFLKGHYREAVAALRAEIKGRAGMRLHLSESFYPAGDEQQIVYETTGRRVVPGGLPKDADCVVCNVSTLRDVAHAMRGVPVTERYITVGGAVKSPRTLLVPLGAPLAALPDLAGGIDRDGCAFIIGGPCMGAAADSLDGLAVTKTTGGLIVIPKNHPLYQKKISPIRRATLSVCCQCSLCTQMCPRYALGLGTSPHKAMRSLCYGGDHIGDVNAVLTCCDCGVCTHFACNFGLDPAKAMRLLKKSLTDRGVRPDPANMREADAFIADKRLSSARLSARLGLSEYDRPAPMDTCPQSFSRVRIPLKMHAGAPSVPVAKQGGRVARGALIAEVPPGALGANIHASIDGEVSKITKDYIEVSEWQR